MGMLLESGQQRATRTGRKVASCAGTNYLQGINNTNIIN